MVYYNHPQLNYSAAGADLVVQGGMDWTYYEILQRLGYKLSPFQEFRRTFAIGKVIVGGIVIAVNAIVDFLAWLFGVPQTVQVETPQQQHPIPAKLWAHVDSRERVLVYRTDFGH